MYTGTTGAIIFTNINSFGASEQVAWTPGSGSWAFTSDRNAKEKFATVDDAAVLAKIAALPVSEWNYIGFADRHIGVMAQDFHRLFPLNPSDTTLNDADLHGVELAGIKGLEKKLSEKDAQIQKLQGDNEQLAQRLDELEAAVRKLSATK